MTIPEITFIAVDIEGNRQFDMVATTKMPTIDLQFLKFLEEHNKIIVTGFMNDKELELMKMKFLRRDD